jgi:hypothetical protein
MVLPFDYVKGAHLQQLSEAFYVGFDLVAGL